MKIGTLFKETIAAAAGLKTLIVFFALTHVVFLAFGQWMVAEGYPAALAIRAEQMKAIQELAYLKPLTGIFADSLILKILYTFAFNLLIGAFLSTTLTGAVFFIPYMVAVSRGFIIGLLISGSGLSPAAIAAFYGTFILEFGAYCVSSAVGADLGLTLISPARKGAATRLEAVKSALPLWARAYLAVAAILLAAAIWEMSWIHYWGPIAVPPKPGGA